MREELQAALNHCETLRKAPLNAILVELIAAKERKRVNDPNRWLAYMESMQVTKHERKVQFADEEPDDPHETP